MIGNLNLCIVDTALDPEAPERTVHYRRSGRRDMYKVRITLDGPDVPFVESVQYTLHPSFTPRVHEVARTPSNPTCTLILWTWGIFDVGLVVRLKSGRTLSATHHLTYDQAFGDSELRFEREAA